MDFVELYWEAVEAGHELGSEAGGAVIQAAFAEREARLREVIAGMLGDLENIEESAALAKHRTLAALKDRTNG